MPRRSPGSRCNRKPLIWIRCCRQPYPILSTTIEETRTELTWDQLPAISGDPVRLIQLFQNLIGNAIKYRKPNASPRIRISAQHTGSLWTFSIEDNGIGIKQRDAFIIFAPLKRLHGPEVAGTGLGLAICKSIVERSGGCIWVESKPGEGSSFRFTWPS